MRTKGENFRNAPKPNLDLYVISFICTNSEAFTTFSAILHVSAILNENGTQPFPCSTRPVDGPNPQTTAADQKVRKFERHLT